MGAVSFTPAVTPETVTVLHLGCGRKKTPEALGLQFVNGSGALEPKHIRMINLDMNPHVEPDILCRLGTDSIDLPDDSVDFVVALHVLEHIGEHQGDMRAWWQFWTELYRVMKPGTRIQFECPYYSSVWAWADPTHVRAISEYTFLYFNQDAYRSNRKQGAMPDYRPPFDFLPALMEKDGQQVSSIETIPDHTNPDVRAQERVSFIRGALIARKPLQPYWEDVL